MHKPLNEWQHKKDENALSCVLEGKITNEEENVDITACFNEERLKEREKERSC